MKDAKNQYRPITDEYYKLYTSFVESGFAEEQAFELVRTYCHNQVVDNIVRELNRKSISKSELRRKFESYKEKREEMTNDQT